VKFVVMIFFRHIKLSSGLIGKDVKPGEKFHPQQLFHRQFPGGGTPYLPLFGLYRIIASRIRNHEVIQPRMATRSRVCRSRQNSGNIQNLDRSESTDCSMVSFLASS
jgi:hypothetical protein